MKPLILILVSFAACAAMFSAPSVAPRDSVSGANKMKITIGSRTFSAILGNNETAIAFRALLPLTLDMHDVNENEKAFDLPSRLPSADANPRTIRTGELMLWNSRTVVVFYKSFSTPYSYTRLGRIDDPDGLAAALGTADVTMKFELQ